MSGGADLALLAPLLDPEQLARGEDLATAIPERLAGLAPPADDAAAREQAREVLLRLGEAGWAAWAVPPAAGGAAPHGVRDCCLLREGLAAVSPLADAVFALQCLATRPLVLAGLDGPGGSWLREAAAGRAMGGFAMTEEEAGSDVAALRTRARRDGGDYVLDGEKWFISNAGIADFYIVFASTDVEAGHRGISAFLVEAADAGCEFAGAQELAAPHPLGRVRFVSCRIPSDRRLGAEGEGFRLGMRTLDRLRPTVAAAACGMAGRALAEARRHARERRQFGRALDEFQLTQARLAGMATELAAARLLTYRAAWELDREGERVALRSAMAKWTATETAQRVIDAAVQILGGRGVLAESPVDHLYRAVRALRIYEGTSEIQQLVIARELGRGADA